MELSIQYRSGLMHQFDMQISDSFMESRIFWIRVISSADESLAVQNTRHTFYELQYALKGNIGMVLENSVPLTAEETEFLIIPPGTFHKIPETGDFGARLIIAFSLVFYDGATQNALDTLNQVYKGQSSAGLRALMECLLEKGHQHTPICLESTTVLTQCILLEVMQMVLDGCRDSQVHHASTAEQEVQRMLAYIRSHNGIGIGVKEIADRFLWSPRQLSRMFHAVTGMGPKEAIAVEKLKKIEELIASTQLNFSEIAELCGFSDGYAMNKFFKRYNHVNLSQFRALSSQKEV